jgi:hypothetical protein
VEGVFPLLPLLLAEAEVEGEVEKEVEVEVDEEVLAVKVLLALHLLLSRESIVA